MTKLSKNPIQVRSHETPLKILFLFLAQMTVCEPQNYLWKCYNPSDTRVEEIKEGRIILEPDKGSKDRIVVKDLSITVCLDNECMYTEVLWHLTSV